MNRKDFKGSGNAGNKAQWKVTTSRHGNAWGAYCTFRKHGGLTTGELLKHLGGACEPITTFTH